MMKGILSAGSSDFIGAVLPQGYVIPKWVVANSISRNGDGSVFDLSVYGNKPERLRRDFFGPLAFNPAKTVYMGDNEGEEPAFKYVLEMGGKVAVPFYATDDFKQHAATKYRAFVPKNEQDLAKFLHSV